MATFEELFPEYGAEPFVPIETNRVRPELKLAGDRARRAIDLGDQPQRTFEEDLDELMAGYTPAPSQGETEWADYGKQAVKSAGDVGTMVTGAGEYLANRVAGDRSTPGEQTFGDLADTFTSGRHATTEFSQNWYDKLTPEARARAEREVFSLDPNQTIWQGGLGEFLSSVGLKMAGSAASTGATLIPGALIMRAGLGRGAITYLGASEGGLSLGSIAANIAQEIEQAPEEELMESERYQQLRSQYDEATARQQFVREAQGYAPVIGGLVVGAISAAAGRYLEPIFVDKAGGLASRFGRGFVSEAAQESGQSGAEQIAQNVAAQVFDADRSAFEGVPEAMGQGALVGGAMGGTTLAAIGPRRSLTAIPTDGANPTPPLGPSSTGVAPEPFSSVFKPQTPPPGGWRGGDIETGSLPDVSSTGQRLIAAGPVDAAVQAALNARADGLIQDMFEQQPAQTPQQEQAAYIQKPWPMGQREMELPQAPTGVVPSSPPTQLPLGVRERVRGGPPRVIEPTPAAPLEQDMSAPGEFSQERLPVNAMPATGRPTRADFMRQRAEQERAQRYAGTVRDENQIDMFADPEAPASSEDIVRLENEISQALTALSGHRPEQGGFEVTLTDDAGNVISQQRASSEAEASQLADAWAELVPDGNITSRPVTPDMSVDRNSVLIDQLSSRISPTMTRGQVQQVYQALGQIAGINTAPAGLRPQMADQPSAEPFRDLRAQIADLQDPDSPRTGVYLSRDNIAQLRKSGLQDMLRSAGVPLANFDGKGGTLIAKNGQVARELTQMRDSGADMQEVIGRATLAGVGKQAGADIAVQQRDEQGNVVRESLVATPEEADALAAQLDQEPGRESVILSAGQAIKRRAIRIREEQAAAQRARVTLTAKKAVAAEAEQIEAGRAAEAAREAAKPAPFYEDEDAATAAMEKISDEDLEKAEGQQLEEMFRAAVTERTGTRAATKATRDESREVAEAAATTTIVPITKPYSWYAERHPSPSLKRKFIRRVQRAKRIRALGGKTKTRPITATAKTRAGTERAAIKAEIEKVQASRAKTAEERKLKKQVIAHLEEKLAKTKESSTVMRASELQPTKAFDLEPPRELSAAEREKYNARVRETYSKLQNSLQAFGTKAASLNSRLQLWGSRREKDGNPTQAARDAIYGRAYLHTLFRYGQMLQALHPRSLVGLKEVERYTALIDDLLSKPDDLLPKLARATEAEASEQAKAAIRVDPTVLKNMGSRRARAALIVEDSKKRRASIAWAKRLHDVWHKNAKYEQHVAPLMQKLIGYVTRDDSFANIASEWRGLGYVPTYSEMRNLRYALRDFRQVERDKLYDPLREWFTELGYRFDKSGDLIIPKPPLKDAEGNVIGEDPTSAESASQYEYAQPPKLLKVGRAAFRNAPLNFNQKVESERRRKLNAKINAERARRAALTPAQRRREDLTMANRIEAARRSGMSFEQRRALEALDRQSPLHLRMSVATTSTPELRAGAEAIAASMEQFGKAQLNASLQKLAASLPADHGYQPLIARLLSLGMDDAIIEWSSSKDIGNTYGLYHAMRDRDGYQWRRIKINRDKLEAARARGEDPAPFFVHAVLHESVHAATSGAIKNNKRLQAAVWAIMRQARASANAQGISLTTEKGGELYGFKDNIVDEFIAEAFSNPVFQAKLREIRIEPQRTVWQVIMDLVKRLLGLDDTPQMNSALDAVMSTTNSLFTGEQETLTRGAETTLHMKESSMASTIGNTLDKIMQSSRVTQGIRARAKDTIEANREGGSRFLLSALTMEQMRDFYANSFGGGRGPLSEYMKAFFQRNADNSANMEDADRLSRRWTKLTEEHGAEKSVELSRVMSESTLYGIHPDETLQSNANEHVKSVQQKQRHADLAKRFKALPQEYRTLYGELKQFYVNTFKREVDLVTLNSLRALLGDNFNYTEADIDRKKLGTVDGMKKEFGDRLTDEQRKIVSRTAALPSMHIGPYFPLMRFGDYIVTAERVSARKSFTDKKAAYAWAQEQRESDPTLSVNVAESDDGYTVTVKEKEVRLAESVTEAEQNRQEMIAEYGAENVDREVQRKSQLYARDSAISSGAGLRTILGKLDGNPAAQQAIKDFYLRSISDGAFRKREIKRANRRGVNYDLQHRTFASYSKASAYYTSQLRHGWKMADALIDMDKFAKSVAKGEKQAGIPVTRMNEVIEEINTRDKLTHDPIEVSKLVRGGTELSQFMMLTSPSYWMINATQPYMVTLPWLAAQTSLGEATAALTSAQKLIISPIVNQMGESYAGLKALWSKAGAEEAFTVLEQVEKHIKQRGGARADEYISMLHKLKRDSIIDLSFVAELRDIAEGQNTSMAQRVLDASRIMSHLTEVNNRILTAVAAYDLYRNKGASTFEAQEFAKQAVSLTQFNYSSGNAPRLFQARGPLGQMGPLVFQFMKYPQHMYALLIDNMRRAVYSGGLDRKIAIKTLAGLFSTHLAAGGLIGAMLQPVKWAIGLAMAAFGDDDEPYTVKNAMSGETFDRMIRNATSELFGNEFGEIASAGLPRAAGVDLSNRMSLGSLYFIDLKTDTAESTLGSLVSSFGGPLVNLGAGFWKGAQYMSEGQLSKGMEAFMPKGAKDVAKAIRYSSEGLTDATGKEIIGADKLSPWQLFAQSAGFQPAQVSEAYARRAAIKDAQGHDEDRRQGFLRRFQNASSPEERADIIRDISEFNRKNPASGISRSQLLRSMQSFRERSIRSSLFGVDLQGDDLLYEEEGRAYE